jgi:hypothetical protein
MENEIKVDMSLNSIHQGLNDLIGFANDETTMDYLVSNRSMLDMDLSRMQFLCSALRALHVKSAREAAE